jgi:hypothetical protein
MIIGRDLISELKLVLNFDTQCISWDGIDQPMKTQGGGLQKETTHYEDLYSSLMAPVSTIFQDDYDATHEPQHAHAANKCISIIDDIEKNNLFGLLRKCEHLFDGTIRKL